MNWQHTFKTIYAATACLGGVAGLSKGLTIAADNKCPHYNDLDKTGKLLENICSFTIVGATTFMGIVFIPPIVLTSPVWCPIVTPETRSILNPNKW